MIRSQRRHTAPVVDPGRQDQLVLIADEVRRRLDPCRRAEHQPGDRDGGGQVSELRIRDGAHLGVGLGAEVLHDHFLDAAVLARDLPDREDRVGPLGQRLADPDQDARGERDAAPAGILQNPQAHGRVLVRAAEVRPAPLGKQALGGGFQHHPHRRRDRLEPLEVLPAQHAGIQVRQQAGLLQHPDGHRAHVGQRVVVAVRVQPLARLLPARLRPVPEREEGFLAAERRAIARDLKHLVRGQERAVQPPRHRHERAVGAAVPAQPGERDEDLARVGDHAGPPGRGQPGVPHPARVRDQGGQVIAARLQQHHGLGLVERLAVPGPGQRTANGARAGRRWLRRPG